MELTSAPGIGCFVPQLPPDPPDVTVLCGTCGSCVRKWWRRRESNLTRLSETGLFLHFRRKARPRNTRVPLNTRSIAPNQPQRIEGSATRRLSVL